MATPTFDTHTAVRKLRSTGMDEQTSESIVEVVSDATSSLVTRDILTTELAEFRAELHRFRADMYRALWIQGAAIVAVLGGIIGLAKIVT